MSYGGDDYGGGPSRGGFRLSLVAAVVLGLFAVVRYFSQTQVNPVTGERQHIAMSVDEEKSMGLQAAPQMEKQMGGSVDASEPRARLVDEVGRRLVERSDAGKSPYADNFHFHLLADPKTINAFALPGGQIFITSALFDKLANEAQLAGVLGHEIGHVVVRHSAQQMAKGQLGQMLATAVGVGASDRQDGGRSAAMAAQMANQMMQLKYGRTDETQADAFGLRYMAQAGYDPSGMLDVMQVLKEASQGGRQPEFLSSHPLPETRLQDIRDILAKTYPDGIPSSFTKGRSLQALGGRGTRPRAVGRGDSY